MSKKLEDVLNKINIEYKSISLIEHHAFKSLLNDVLALKGIDLTDNYNRTILHYVVKDIVGKKFKNERELKSKTSLIKDIRNIMSEQALNEVDAEGKTALNIASISSYIEISWAVIDDIMPSYIKPSFVISPFPLRPECLIGESSSIHND